MMDAPRDLPPRPRVLGMGPRRPQGPNLVARMLMQRGETADTLALLDELAATYGDVAWARLGPFSFWILRHPEDIETILVSANRSCIKDRMARDLSVVLGNGLLTSHGPAWRRNRRLAAPSLAKNRVMAYDDVIVAASRACASTLIKAEGAPRDVHAAMTSLALDIVVRALFGDHPPTNAGRIGSLLEDFTTLFTERRTGWSSLLPIDVQTPSAARMHTIRDEIWSLMEAMIERQRALGGEGDARDQQHLLARLLHASDDSGHRLDHVQLRDELTTLFLAGHETTALTLTFALREIGLDDSLCAQLRDEAIAATAATDGPLTSAALPALPLSRAVILESMRLYPPAWGIGREALAPIQLRQWTIPQGAQILTPQWLVQRDPRWFRAPLRFHPKRWLDPEASRARPRMSYFPFGGGARICVGQHFALVEAVLALSTLARTLKVRTIDPTPVPLFAGITLRPRAPVRCEFHPW